MTITQEQISHLLGVRRESVTQTEGKLQKEGLITKTRGSITVVDRAKLEERTGECNAAVKLECERLLLPPKENH
jgi:Mn-dependent DtxR family transcriptional regulator